MRGRKAVGNGRRHQVDDFEVTTEVVDLVWSQISSSRNHQWNSNLPSLTPHIPAAEIEALERETDSWVQNRQLRSLVSRYLRSSDAPVREGLIRWIVQVWGRIRGGDKEAPKEWATELGRFDDEQVGAFMQCWRDRRLASWTKVLSFAAHEKFPIYDAQNALTLNVILAEAGHRIRFKVPDSQVVGLNELRDHLNRRERTRLGVGSLTWHRYPKYLDLLHNVTKKAARPDVLETEMHLFANSLHILRDFGDREGIYVTGSSVVPQPPKKAKQNPS